MTDNSKRGEDHISKNLIAKMLNHLRSILDGYMKQYPQYEELFVLMSDEKLLFNSEGKPTEKYIELIKEFEKHCVLHPIDVEEIAKEDSFTSNEIEILKGVKGFLDKQRELMESYSHATDKENWKAQVLDSDEKCEVFDNVLKESTERVLNNYVLKK